MQWLHDENVQCAQNLVGKSYKNRYTSKVFKRSPQTIVAKIFFKRASRKNSNLVSLGLLLVYKLGDGTDSHKKVTVHKDAYQEFPVRWQVRNKQGALPTEIPTQKVEVSYF